MISINIPSDSFWKNSEQIAHIVAPLCARTDIYGIQVDLVTKLSGIVGNNLIIITAFEDGDLIDGTKESTTNTEK